MIRGLCSIIEDIAVVSVQLVISFSKMVNQQMVSDQERSEKCLQIAQKHLLEDDHQTALHYLYISQQLCPSNYVEGKYQPTFNELELDIMPQRVVPKLTCLRAILDRYDKQSRAVNHRFRREWSIRN